MPLPFFLMCCCLFLEVITAIFWKLTLLLQLITIIAYASVVIARLDYQPLPRSIRPRSSPLGGFHGKRTVHSVENEECGECGL